MKVAFAHTKCDKAIGVFLGTLPSAPHLQTVFATAEFASPDALRSRQCMPLETPDGTLSSVCVFYKKLILLALYCTSLSKKLDAFNSSAFGSPVKKSLLKKRVGNSFYLVLAGQFLKGHVNTEQICHLLTVCIVAYKLGGQKSVCILSTSFANNVDTVSGSIFISVLQKSFPLQSSGSIFALTSLLVWFSVALDFWEPLN